MNMNMLEYVVPHDVAWRVKRWKKFLRFSSYSFPAGGVTFRSGGLGLEDNQWHYSEILDYVRQIPREQDPDVFAILTFFSDDIILYNFIVY